MPSNARSQPKDRVQVKDYPMPNTQGQSIVPMKSNIQSQTQQTGQVKASAPANYPVRKDSHAPPNPQVKPQTNTPAYSTYSYQDSNYRNQQIEQPPSQHASQYQPLAQDAPKPVQYIGYPFSKDVEDQVNFGQAICWHHPNVLVNRKNEISNLRNVVNSSNETFDRRLLAGTPFANCKGYKNKANKANMELMNLMRADLDERKWGWQVQDLGGDRDFVTQICAKWTSTCVDY